MHAGCFFRSKGDKIVEKSDKLLQKFYPWFLKVVYFVLIMLYLLLERSTLCLKGEGKPETA